MKNFSEMSNFELNLDLAIALNGDEEWVNKHSDIVPDYCNTPNDILPPSTKLRISLNPSVDGKHWHAINQKGDITATSINPTRALVIVAIQEIAQQGSPNDNQWGEK